MSFLDLCTSWLAPHECLGCRAEGKLLCNDCFGELTSVSPCCFRCYAPSKGFITCENCHAASRLQSVHPVTRYEGLAKDLIWRLKSGGTQAAATLLAEQMAVVLQNSLNTDEWPTHVVPVPTASGRARQRGYDQAKLLARELSRRTRLPYLDCLARQGQTHQVGASREQRLVQLAEAFRVKKAHRFTGATLLLVDDVITTGATLEAAAAILREHGADSVCAAVFAQA